YGYHGCRAVLAGGIADVEHVEVAAAGIVSQPVGSLPHADLAEQPLIRAAEDTHPSTTTIGGEEQVVLAVDQDASHPRELRQRAQMGLGGAPEYVDAIGAGVGHVQARRSWRGWSKDVGVIEPWLAAPGDRDKACLHKCHATLHYIC